MSPSETVQAVYSQYGKARDVVELQTVPIVNPANGSVRVRMLAAPINPSDLLSCEGHYNSETALPALMGFEGVGIVEASGGGALGWLRQGKRVAVVSRMGGTWGTRCLTEAETVIPVPDQLSLDQATVYFINPASALLMTRWILKVPPQCWLLQSAANSALGRMVIRLGKQFGFRTLNVIRSEKHRDELNCLGADAVVVADGSTSQSDFFEQVKLATNGEPVRFAIDAVAGHTGGLLFNSLGQGGRMLAYGSLTHDAIPVQPRPLIVQDRRLEGFFLGNEMKKLPLLKKLRLIGELKSLHLKSLFEVETFQKFPLREIHTAIDAAENKTGGRKILLQLE